LSKAYYGDKISKNITETPEGYLVCANVKIGRVGWMDYMGQELPSGCNEPLGGKCQVYRSREELFSPETIASFENMPVTNTHPTSNLDINTATMAKRGHVQNVRPEGDFLVADLFIDDAGLISEILNNLKREVSCGYDCLWPPYGNKNDGRYEQKEIRGNHVAIVQSGRAGPRVAIQDSKKEQGGNRMAKSITHSLLAAIGLKQWAMDAEPEEVEKAMDEIKKSGKDEPDKKEVKDEEMIEKKSAKDEEESAGQQEKEDARYKELEEKFKALEEKFNAKDKTGKDKKANDAKSIMDSITKAFDKSAKDNDDDKEEAKDTEFEKAKDDDDEDEDDKKESKDDDVDYPTEEAGGAADSTIRKFVHDMSPIIMSHQSEAVRLQGAKALQRFVSGGSTTSNAYGAIASKANTNRMSAMDRSNETRQQSAQERSMAACKALSNSGEHLRGGK
jgi:hypothetical protein